MALTLRRTRRGAVAADARAIAIVAAARTWVFLGSRVAVVGIVAHVMALRERFFLGPERFPRR